MATCQGHWDRGFVPGLNAGSLSHSPSPRVARVMCLFCSAPSFPTQSAGVLCLAWPALSNAGPSITHVSGLLLGEPQLTTTALAPFHCEGVTKLAFKSGAEKTPQACSFFLTGAGAHERSDSSSQSHPGLAGSRHTKACLSHPSAGSEDPGQGLKMAA